MCQNCSNFITPHKTINLFDLIMFLFKSLHVFNLSAATKNLRIDCTFFVKPTCFLLFRETRRPL